MPVSAPANNATTTPRSVLCDPNSRPPRTRTPKSSGLLSHGSIFHFAANIGAIFATIAGAYIQTTDCMSDTIFIFFFQYTLLEMDECIFLRNFFLKYDMVF